MSSHPAETSLARLGEIALTHNPEPATAAEFGDTVETNTTAKIPWELLAANKSIVNKAFELMGRIVGSQQKRDRLLIETLS